MPAVFVTLFEHQFLPYSDIPGFPQSGTQREHILEKIEKINQVAGVEIIQPGRKGLSARNQVGLFQVGHIQIEILPKIDYTQTIPNQTGSNSVQLTKPSHKRISQQPDAQNHSAARNLLIMLSYAYGLKIHEQDLSHLATDSLPWMELLTRLFATGLYREILSGLSQSYIPVEETLPVLRGRWNIQQQLLKHGHQPHQFDVSYDELSPDIPLNQVFRLTIERLRITSQDPDNRLLLDDLSEWFGQVSLVNDVSPTFLENIQFNRLNERFQPSFNLARLFLSGNAVRISSGNLLASAFTFDMNRLFERFITAFLIRHRSKVLPEDWQDTRILPQSEGTRIFLAKSEGRPVLRLQPDLLITPRREANPRLIIDTKYKVLEPVQRKLGVSPDDLYQMIAYALRFNCPHILLIYPQTGAAPIRKMVQVESGEIQIAVATVNLGVPFDFPDDLITELSQMIQFFR